MHLIDCIFEADCGHFDVQPNLETVTRIVGGEVVKPHSWPFIGSLQVSLFDGILD